MPELPEVENVRLSLESQGSVGQMFERVELLRKNLRTPLRSELVLKLPGQSFRAITRRAKFLLFETEDYILLNHLGMTGSWRTVDGDFTPQKHDHVVLHFESGLKFVYNDPRRFGILELVNKHDVTANRWLKHLGVEPLSAEFTRELLFSGTRKRKAPIKGFLMNQKNVVGVGNIYASEALYMARVAPTRQAGRVKKIEAEKLVACIREVLQSAIKAGGSTISDYRNSKGQAGNFQTSFCVYDRKAKPCPSCATPIRSRVIAGRNSFWCPKCQR